MNQIRLDIAKDRFKFSAAHMTIFPDGSKEPLHGHNYSVHFAVVLNKTDFSSMVSFSVFKKTLATLCEELDESVLLASQNPFVEINERDGACEVIACKKRYLFPSDEVRLLPIDNVNVENLSQLLANRFAAKLDSELKKIVSEIEITIEETAGQSCSFALTIE